MFEELFERSNHLPIEYNGKQVMLYDTIVLPREEISMRIRFEQTNSNWEQGVFLKGKGIFIINNAPFKDSIYLWHKTTPPILDILFQPGHSDLKVWNIWRVDNGAMQYGHNGAALYFEEIENGRRYYCNDGHPNDDFDDLIFSIEYTTKNIDRTVKEVI